MVVCRPTGRCGVERQGHGSVGGEVLRWGYCSLPFGFSTVCGSHPFPVVRVFSRLSASFLWWWKPQGLRDWLVLPTLNLRVRRTPFKMETLQSVFLSERSGDWMVSIDLKDTYLQVPIHPDSRKYLSFVALNQVFQSKALCFGLSTAPQFFTRVIALVSAILHPLGIRRCRYLDDWLIQAPSRSLVLQALETVVHLCQDLGVVISWEKSILLPSQQVVYLGVTLDSTLFRAPPSQPRVEKLWLIAETFLSCSTQPISLWRRLLGVLSSLVRLWIHSLEVRSSSPVGSERRLHLNSVTVFLRTLSEKVLFLLSLATAKWVSDLQALSSIVSFSSEGAMVSYVPEFLAKTEVCLATPSSLLLGSVVLSLQRISTRICF